ncbi:MAG TPA: SARP family transcriptional regulator [Actinomycetota bacterium]|nr:SARP family transcriptional regulator [Actinomycetota bacterium]
MGLSIHLLGRPSATRDGKQIDPVRGRKAWGLLAFLVCTGRAVSREQLAQLLFGEADDPLGALRWNLAEVRRLLGDPSALKGEMVRLDVPPGTWIDVRAIAQGTWHEMVRISGLGQDLLEGMAFAASPAFEAWLLSERRHVQSIAEGLLREAAHARLAAGEWGAAGSLAMDQFSEAAHALLIRSLAAGGDREAAARQRAACIELFRRELGASPGATVMHALDPGEELARTAAPTGGRAGASAQLEAGEAAVHAGAIEAGLTCLRRAIAESHEAGAGDLEARALLAYGSALVHAARGRYEEATTALQRSILLAGGAGEAATAAAAHGELAWMECNAGRYERAEAAIGRATEHLEPDHLLWAWARMGLASCRLAQGRYGEAIDLITRGLRQADNDGELQVRIACRAQLGLIRLMRGELDAARVVLDEALALSQSGRMVKLTPYPQAVLAEFHLVSGDLDLAAHHFEQAFALACQLEDPCWEGLSLRGMGLLAARRGDVDTALAALEDAYARSGRHPDSDQWIVAYILDALCATAIQSGRVPGRALEDLASLASRTGMTEFLARAYGHRARLGDPAALRAAVFLAAGVDNPALHRDLARVAGEARGQPPHWG